MRAEQEQQKYAGEVRPLRVPPVHEQQVITDRWPNAHGRVLIESVNRADAASSIDIESLIDLHPVRAKFQNLNPVSRPTRSASRRACPASRREPPISSTKQPVRPRPSASNSPTPGIGKHLSAMSQFRAFDPVQDIAVAFDPLLRPTVHTLLSSSDPAGQLSFDCSTGSPSADARSLRQTQRG